MQSCAAERQAMNGMSSTSIVTKGRIMSRSFLFQHNEDFAREILEFLR
jgi:hypothetical protein